MEAKETQKEGVNRSFGGVFCEGLHMLDGSCTKVCAIIASATQSYVKAEFELQKGTHRPLHCRTHCLLCVSAVCGSVPP